MSAIKATTSLLQAVVSVLTQWLAAAAAATVRLAFLAKTGTFFRVLAVLCVLWRSRAARTAR